MNPVAAILVAYACISPVEPAGASHTVAYQCSPPRVESAAVKPRAKRKSRLASLNPNVPGWVLRRKHECGSEKPTWYWSRKRNSWKHGCSK